MESREERREMKPSANARKVAAQRSAQRLSDVQRGISLLRDRRLAKGHVQEVLQKLVVNRFVSRFQMGLEQLQKEDRKEEEEEEEDLYDLPETPHTRRETLVGASCISPPLSNTTSVGITDSGLPWNAIQGSRRLCNCLLLLAFAPSKSAMAGVYSQYVLMLYAYDLHLPLPLPLSLSLSLHLI